MRRLDFKPKLIMNIVTDLVPKMLDMNKYIETSKIRSQSIETINDAFCVLENKRRQVAHTKELWKKIPSLDKHIDELFVVAYKQVMDAVDLLQTKIDNDEEPLEEDGATFEEMQDEYLLLAIKILHYCSDAELFKESFNRILINNELVDPI